MSEPVPSVDIEDVLSSIRRLVSDDNRPAPKPEPDDVPHKPTRLVLTPSLLVSELAQTESLPEEPAMSVPEPEFTDSDFGASESGGMADDIASDEVADPLTDVPDVAVQDTGQDRETDDDSGSEPETDFQSDSHQTLDLSEYQPDTETDKETSRTPWSDPDTTLFEAAKSAESTEGDEDSDFAESLHFDDDGSGEHDDGPLTGEVDPVEEYSAAEPPEEISGDLSGEDNADQADLAAGDLHDMPEDPVLPPLQDDAGDYGDDAQSEASEWSGDNWESSSDDAESSFEPVDADEPYNTATLGAKIAALEAQIAQTSDQWEPDGELGDDYAGTKVETIEWQDHDVVAPVVPRRVSADDHHENDAHEDESNVGTIQAEPEGDAGNIADVLAGDDAILDEESLRELVADIVRQELQGALGERITRNVRKLVRREIHRALTAQELD